jgi:hypothetical protein
VTESDDDARALHGRKRKGKGDIATGNVAVPGSGVGRTAPARKTFGEKLAVSVAEGSNERGSVSIESRLVFGLIDWGENKKNVDRFFDLLRTRLTTDSRPFARRSAPAPVRGRIVIGAQDVSDNPSPRPTPHRPAPSERRSVCRSVRSAHRPIRIRQSRG